MNYYLVRYGGIFRMKQAKDYKDACRKTFGLVSDTMQVQNLGRNKGEAFKKADKIQREVVAGDVLVVVI